MLWSTVWRLELGDPIEVAELVAAARLARSFSSVTAERLARAAIGADPCAVVATVLLAEILSMQGRVAEVDALLDGIDLAELDDTDRQAVLYARALGRTRLGEVRDVVALTTGTAADASSPQLQAMYGQALMLDGALDEARNVAEPLFAATSLDPISRTLAAFTLVAGGTFTGQFTETEQILHAALPLAEASRATLPYGIATVKVSAVIARSTAGRLDDADLLAHQMYDEALSEDDEWLRPRGASGLGVTALIRGRARTAARYFRITVASLNEFDGLFLRYNLSYLARAAALAGFIDEARAALQAPVDAPRFPLFQADWEMAEAAVLAAEGKRTEATARAFRAARHAATRGAWASALLAAHDAARYGGSSDAAEIAITAAERVSGRLPRVIGDHALASARRDQALLDAVSRRFEDIGAILYAAEASYAAARRHQSAGDGRLAARAIVRARTLHSRCEGASVPWVSALHSPEALTPREHQVALLAAAGDADAAIAATFKLSIRTVQNHLTRTYTKLGITSRRCLADALNQTTRATSRSIDRAAG